MEIMKKETKPLFRIDIKEYATKKVNGFNVYESLKEKQGLKNKINLADLVNKIKEKVEEI